MKKIMRLGLFWITTLLFITGINGQITFVNPPSDTSVTCSNLNTFPDTPETVHECEGSVFVFFTDFSDRTLSTDTCSFYEYTVTRVFTATNNCEDTTKHIQIISVIDTISPIFTPPSAVTINCNDLNNLEIAGNVASFADECGGPTSATYLDDSTQARCGATIITSVDKFPHTSETVHVLIIVAPHSSANDATFPAISRLFRSLQLNVEDQPRLPT